MFAPKIAKASTKAPDSPTGKLVPQPSTLATRHLAGIAAGQSRPLQGTIGSQATLQHLTQRISNLTAKGLAERHDQAAAPENMTTREASRGPSWDFTAIPVFAPDRAKRHQARSLLNPLPSPGVIQPKLVVGEVNDPLEHEANRVADRVVRKPDPAPAMSAAPPQIGRKCKECEYTETLQVKPAATSTRVSAGVPPIVQEVLRTPGRPLDAAARAFFEPRFGHDLGGVRVSADDAAARSAAAVGARAYTVGQRIAFAAGQYEPRTSSGRYLLAHELVHVMQHASSLQVPVLRRAAGGVKPPVPKPGQTPFNFIVESPAVGNWKEAVKGMLEREYQRKFKDFEEAQEHFRQHLKNMPDDRARERFADRMRDRARKAFYRKERSNPSYAYTEKDLARLESGAAPESGLQLEHMGDVKTKMRGGAVIEGQPERALDPGNIYTTEGGTRGTAPRGTKHAEKYRTIDRAKKTSQEIRGKTPQVTRSKEQPAPMVRAQESSLPNAASPPKVATGEPAKPVGEIPETPTPTPKGKSGFAGELFGFAFPLIAGIIHQRAVERRIEEKANKQGYAPHGTPSGEGLLYDLGSWFLDPGNDADEAVSFDKRFNLPVWRQHLRDVANGKQPGDTLRVQWDVGRCSFDILGRQKIDTKHVKYKKQASGKWEVISGDATGTPDINDIISTSVSDQAIKAIVYDDPCSA